MPKAADISNKKVKDLCFMVVPNSTAVYLNVELSDDSVLNECYENVAKMIKKKGGSIQYGWQIWETLSGVMIEAEFHAVWVDDEGVFHDITPKSLPVDKILFLPDHARRYEG
jgi:hypothetical protein